LDDAGGDGIDMGGGLDCAHADSWAGGGKNFIYVRRVNSAYSGQLPLDHAFLKLTPLSFMVLIGTCGGEAACG
jgi:hypothetical protein